MKILILLEQMYNWSDLNGFMRNIDMKIATLVGCFAQSDTEKIKTKKNKTSSHPTYFILVIN